MPEAGIGWNVPVVPIRYSIVVSVVSIRSETPLNEKTGGIGSLFCSNIGADAAEAAAPVVARYRNSSVVTSLGAIAVAGGIRLDTINVSPRTATHAVPPFILYSIWFVTPVTVSVVLLYPSPAGAAPETAGTFTILIWDAGIVTVAIKRMYTLVLTSSKVLRGIVIPGQSTQRPSSPTRYCIAVLTPVIAFCEAVYTAPGAAGRAGTITLRASDAAAEPVAATRIWTVCAVAFGSTGRFAPVVIGINTPAVPMRYCIKFDVPVIAPSSSSSPLNVKTGGVGKRGGSVMTAWFDAAMPVAALFRIHSVTSPLPFDGIRFDTLNVAVRIATHVVPPFMLYSI
jgi:hypothetical protein